MSASLQTNDYLALAAFRYELRKFLRFSKEYLAHHQLTPAQYEALLALQAFSSDKGLTVGELSERLQVKHHTAVSLTDKLARRNLVTKYRAEPDRRNVCVKLTANGTAILAAVAMAHRREMRSRSPAMIEALKALRR